MARLLSSLASVYAVAGGSGSWISVSHSTSFRGSWRSGGRNKEPENWRLESKIWEHLEKTEPQIRDWGHYFKTIEDLRTQIFAYTVDNARIVLKIDNVHLGLAAGDFRVKYETELAMRQSVESDIWARHDH
ncbi:hypothetical protein P7K49_004934 [Saguinus oedipus]|uniref:IF rod domain-containing protein n=1 Tax=Saguinus oedipus TaxID=9490 RepID=A0ABQ9W8V6_SAGOE|nr:hypothetical protein P7K49_004934 [Saguinus oedipus]